MRRADWLQNLIDARSIEGRPGALEDVQSRIVDQDVEPAEFFPDALGGGFHRGAIDDVQHLDRRAPAGRGNEASGFIERSLAPAGQHNLAACPREGHRRRAPDPASGSGDPRDLAFDRRHMPAPEDVRASRRAAPRWGTEFEWSVPGSPAGRNWRLSRASSRSEGILILGKRERDAGLSPFAQGPFDRFQDGLDGVRGRGFAQARNGARQRRIAEEFERGFRPRQRARSASPQWCQKRASRMITGIGTPRSHRRMPRPKPMPPSSASTIGEDNAPTGAPVPRPRRLVERGVAAGCDFLRCRTELMFGVTLLASRRRLRERRFPLEKPPQKKPRHESAGARLPTGCSPVTR